ncbi:MAG: Jag N-terminal domain-containing protein, partial [Armatimonadota bacterium]|nr:Jag N-terminal domain-containing protein [Armatimonadota bacterium]
MKSPQHEMRTVEEVGRTVEEAVERAIAHLGVARDRVQVDVLDE